jgi:hypothetical protein
MPSSIEPPGHVYKSNRALDLIEQLEREVNSWFEDTTHATISKGYDPNAPTDYVVSATAVPIPIDAFSLLIGDIVHNLRSSLDFIAFELAAAHTQSLTDDQARQSQFPIVGDQDKEAQFGAGANNFSSRARRSISCIESKAQNVIETVQPYKRGTEYREHPLWYLQELSNIDKHRYLHVAAASVAKLNISNCQLGKHSVVLRNLKRIENNAEMVRLKGVKPNDPNENLDNLVVLTLTIAFSDGSLADKLVIPVLNEIHSYMAEEVLMPLQELLSQELLRSQGIA